MRERERAQDSRRAARALVLGESLIDVIIDGDRRTERPGGSPMNLSIGLARQGVDVAFVTSLGADDHADTIERRLVTEGVDVYTPWRQGRTSVAIATLDTAGNPSYDFDLHWSLHETHLPVGEPDVVHFGSIATVLQPGADHVDDLVARFRTDALVTYDPNIRPRIDRDRAVARRRVDRHAALSDVVKASDEDLAYLHPEFAADPAHPTETETQAMIDASIERWLTSGCAMVVITRSQLGIDIATPHHRLHLDSNRPTIVDTIGGGDAYMAGLIAGIDAIGLLRGHLRDDLASVDAATLRGIGCWAQRTAEVTVGRVGAEPPTSLELLEVRQCAVA